MAGGLWPLRALCICPEVFDGAEDKKPNQNSDLRPDYQTANGQIKTIIVSADVRRTVFTDGRTKDEHANGRTIFYAANGDIERTEYPNGNSSQYKTLSDGTRVLSVHRKSDPVRVGLDMMDGHVQKIVEAFLSAAAEIDPEAIDDETLDRYLVIKHLAEIVMGRRELSQKLEACAQFIAETREALGLNQVFFKILSVGEDFRVIFNSDQLLERDSVKKFLSDKPALKKMVVDLDHRKFFAGVARAIALERMKGESIDVIL